MSAVVPAHGVPFGANRETAPAYRAFGVLWVILVDSEQTGGAFSVMEQEMPAGDGPPPHVHPIGQPSFAVRRTTAGRSDAVERARRAPHQTPAP